MKVSISFLALVLIGVGLLIWAIDADEPWDSRARPVSSEAQQILQLQEREGLRVASTTWRQDVPPSALDGPPQFQVRFDRDDGRWATLSWDGDSVRWEGNIPSSQSAQVFVSWVQHLLRQTDGPATAVSGH